MRGKNLKLKKKLKPQAKNSKLKGKSQGLGGTCLFPLPKWCYKKAWFICFCSKCVITTAEQSDHQKKVEELQCSLVNCLRWTAVKRIHLSFLSILNELNKFHLSLSKSVGECLFSISLRFTNCKSLTVRKATWRSLTIYSITRGHGKLRLSR